MIRHFDFDCFLMFFFSSARVPFAGRLEPGAARCGAAKEEAEPNCGRRRAAVRLAATGASRSSAVRLDDRQKLGCHIWPIIKSIFVKFKHGQ